MNRPTAATFALHNPDIRTVFPITATGVMLNVYLHGDIGTVAIMVDVCDNHAVERLLSGEINAKAGVKVTNLLNGEILTVVRTDCGSGCQCALRFTKTTW